MKYLAIAGFAAVATALTPADPAAYQWEPAVPVVKTSTWTTWAPPAVKTETWSNVPPKKADPTWKEWENKPVYTTTVVTAITTYCPEPTTVVHAGKTWVVTKATTLTITECPCTISVPVYTKTTTSCGETKTPVKPDEKNTWVDVKTPVKGDEKSTWVNVPVSPSKTPVAADSTWANVPAAATGTWSPVGVWKGAAPANTINNALVLGAGAVAGAAALLL